MVGKLGSSGGLGMSIEVVGDQVEALSLAGRTTLASMATEMGAICALIEPSKWMLDHFSKFGGRERPAHPVHDPDYPFERTVEMDVGDLEPMMSLPGRPDRVVPVSSAKDQRVDSVFIGSCTNGSFEDVARVADITRGRKVHPGVMAMIVPATRHVWKELLDTGRIGSLFESGFIVSNPGCGGCASGQIGMTGVDEVQVSTSNRNFVGKQGSGKTYLASPETAAASAVLGRIATLNDLEAS
jgi:homoaconitase/3-isopropylmalate dehydratase large subunit